MCPPLPRLRFLGLPLKINTNKGLRTTSIYPLRVLEAERLRSQVSELHTLNRLWGRGPPASTVHSWGLQMCLDCSGLLPTSAPSHLFASLPWHLGDKNKITVTLETDQLAQTTCRFPAGAYLLKAMRPPDSRPLATCLQDSATG